MKDLSDKELDELEKQCRDNLDRMDKTMIHDPSSRKLWSRILRMITELRRWREQEFYDAIAAGDVDFLDSEEN